MGKNKRKNQKHSYSENISNNYVQYYGKGYGEAGASGKKKALKGFTAQSGSVNEDIIYNLSTLRRRSRMLYMAAPIATSAIKTTRTNVVGVGLTPASRIDLNVIKMTPEQAEKWQKRTQREFALWAEDARHCDARGINDFYDLQGIALLGALMNGDSFALIKRAKRNEFRPYSLRLDLLEADLISTPNKFRTAGLNTDGENKENNNKIYDGVEIDSTGLVVAYHICNKYPNESGRYREETKWVRVPVEGEKTFSKNILHVMDTERAGQYRGVPLISQIIEPLLQMRRYTESELMAALVNSFFTAFVTTEKDTNVLDSDLTAEEDTELVEGDLAMGPGIINQLNPGENITFGDPKHPNSGFEKFIVALCQQCGAALEIPHEVLMKAFTSSYSASRAALIEAWKVFRMRRKWFVADFCNPVWELFMDEAVALGRIYAPGYFTNPILRKAYLGARWTGPTQGQLDPVKEVTAEILKNQNGYATHEESTITLNGSDFDENINQLARESEKIANVKTNLSINISTEKGEE